MSVLSPNWMRLAAVWASPLMAAAGGDSALMRASVEYTTFVAPGEDATPDPVAVSVAEEGEAYVAVPLFRSEVLGTGPSGAPRSYPVNRILLVKISADGDESLFRIVHPRFTRRPALAIDERGNVYLAGETTAAEFETTLGAVDQGGPGFVIKYDSSGARVFAARLPVRPTAIAVDSDENVYLTGQAAEGFVSTPGALQTFQASGGCSPGPFTRIACSDAFVAKLKSDGFALDWATFLGGSLDEMGYAIGVDARGSTVVVGETGSVDFPGAARPEFGGVVEVGQLKLGDGFVARLNPGGTGLIYSSFLGGSARDEAVELDVASDGSALVAGATSSTDFPAANGGPGGFVVGLAPWGALGDDRCHRRRPTHWRV